GGGGGGDGGPWATRAVVARGPGTSLRPESCCRRPAGRLGGGGEVPSAMAFGAAAGERQPEPERHEQQARDERDDQGDAMAGNDATDHVDRTGHRAGEQHHSHDREPVGRPEHLLLVCHVTAPVEAVVDRRRDEEGAGGRRGAGAEEVSLAEDGAHLPERGSERRGQQEAEEQLYSRKGNAELVEDLGPLARELAALLC